MADILDFTMKKFREALKEMSDLEIIDTLEIPSAEIEEMTDAIAESHALRFLGQFLDTEAGILAEKVHRTDMMWRNLKALLRVCEMVDPPARVMEICEDSDIPSLLMDVAANAP